MPSNDSTPREFVVIASPDGERWSVEDLDVGDAAFEIWTLETIISGDRVLVHRQGEDVMVFEVRARSQPCCRFSAAIGLTCVTSSGSS